MHKLDSNKTNVLQEEKDFIKQLLDPKTQKAFQKLLSDYQNLIPSYSYYCHDDTDDVLQNTFIKIFQNLKNFKGESKLFSWMYRIATNESLTLNQKQKKVGQLLKQFKTKRSITYRLILILMEMKCK
jgi:RNA polymerase sigma-70 factor (ECF subfamily)